MQDVDPRYKKYLKNFPVMPDVATRIMSIAGDEIEISFKELANIIKVDPGLSAKILKIANSALYARQREITNIQAAITLLGFKNLKSLVLLVTASNLLTGGHASSFYRRFWSHSVHSAFISRHMCLRRGLKEDAEEAFTGALLQDIGQVALYNHEPKRYEELLDHYEGSHNAASPASTGVTGPSKPTLLVLEQSTFGIDHRQLGAAVFESWYFPQTFVDIAREHGSRNIVSERKQIILIISLASVLADLLGLGFGRGDEEGLHELLRASALTENDVAYYRTDYLRDILGDPLFLQCRELFGIE